ncbi:hypothetical protein EZS27_016596 [termite gut metagenome]|uniref:Uncharacterized protein n=1 Tax=termite gut metagenome TaxID=433724 RepID=A0A5J4RPS4_9ZZZZ
MAVDLRHPFNEGMNLLLTWRNRYSKVEYGEKVLMNIFYRKYTMEFMWNEIDNSFQKKIFGGRKVLWNDFNQGFQKLKSSYQQNAVSKTQPVLMNLLTEQSQRKVGTISYASYKDRIIGARQGNKNDIEEIEYAYLYYLLTDESILLWGAFGGTGLSKIEAIGKMTGLVIETEELNSYDKIDNMLSQLCVAPYLHKIYNPLPPL